MTALMTFELPPQIARRLSEFCAARKSGMVQLDIKNGSIVSFKITESGYVDKLTP